MTPIKMAPSFNFVLLYLMASMDMFKTKQYNLLM